MRLPRKRFCRTPECGAGPTAGLARGWLRTAAGRRPLVGLLLVGELLIRGAGQPGHGAGAAVADDSPAAQQPAPGTAASAAAILPLAEPDRGDQADPASQLNARLLTGLLRRPRFGPTFEKVYAFHRQRRSIDELAAAVLKQASTAAADGGPQPGAAWLLYGMLELRRGNHAAAAAALRTSESLRPEDPAAPWYLGKALLAEDLRGAAAALERALSLAAARGDRLEISTELASLYQRLRQPDQQQRVWLRLEQQYPDDQQIQLRLAEALANTGDLAAALQRFQRLSQQADDPAAQVQFALQAADLQVRLGQLPAAVSGLQVQLQQLRSDSWLAAEVRSRLENVWLQAGDRAAMLEWYRQQVASQPEDVSAVLRLGELLLDSGRAAEVRRLYEQAVQRLPTDARLRRVLIADLTRGGDRDAALEQHRQLQQLQPEDSENIERWGRLLLRDTRRSLSERQARAAEVWQLLLAGHADDPVRLRHLADLLREAGMTEQAVVHYRRCLELVPGDVRLRGELAEYLQQQGQADAAQAVLETMAADEQQSATTRLQAAAELQRVGFADAAAQAARGLTRLSLSFSERLQLAGLLTRQKQFDEALAQLERLRTQLLSAADTTDAQRRQLLAAELLVLVDSHRLEDHMHALSAELRAGQNVTADRWWRLAELQSAAGAADAAWQSLEQAVVLRPQAVELQTLRVAWAEQSGRLAEAVQSLRLLADFDAAHRGQHLLDLIRLHLTQGEVAAALPITRELLDGERTRPEDYQAVARLLLKHDQPEPARQLLAEGVQRFPDDPQLGLTLAEVLVEQQQTEAALTLCWQLFEEADSMDRRQRLVELLAPLYDHQQIFEQLVARLDLLRQDPGQHRAMTVCLAAAYVSVSRFDQAQSTLETLLTDNPQDIDVLRQLSRICERAGQLRAAADYERRSVRLAPSAAGRNRLAGLLLREGSDLERAGQMSVACDVYLQALRDDSSRFAANFETHLQSFETARRLPDLARGVLVAGVDLFRDAAPQLIHLGAMAGREEAADNPGPALITAVLDGFPEQRLGHLLLAYQLRAVDDREFVQRLLAACVPAARTGASAAWDPWGQPDGMPELPRLLTDSSEVGTVAQTVKERTVADPGWLGGQLLLMLLQAMQGDAAAAQQSLEHVLQAAATGPTDDQRIPDTVALQAVEALSACRGDWHRLQILLLESCLQTTPATARPRGDRLIYRLRNLYLSHGQPEQASALPPE